MASRVKTEKLCRTCLSKDNELCSLYDVYIKGINLSYIVTAITGLKISKYDGLPSTICCECKEKAAQAFDFKTKSEEAHLSLQDQFKKEKNELSSSKSTSHPKTNIKTEDVSPQDDDYMDADFNLSELSDQMENLKAEDEFPTENETHRCKTCLLVFDTQAEFNKHKKIKCNVIKVEFSEQSNSFCPLCGSCYDGTENLTKHMWEFHANLMGPRKRGRPKKLKTDMILNKLSENGFYITAVPIKKYECSFCQLELNSKEELVIHIGQHKDTKILCCELCKKMYINEKMFADHTCVENHNDIVQQNENHTKFNYATEMQLQQLLELNELGSGNMIHVCSACSIVFLTENELINHHDAQHPELSQRCNLCTKVFASVRSAARHRSICKQMERKHKCNTCGLKFAYEISLNKHILRYHEGQSVSVKFIDPKTKSDEAQFQCDTCNRSFQRRDLLIKHTKLHMPNEKYYECDICKKKFSRKDNLRSHKRIHDVHRDKTPSKNCLCLYCGRSFSNSSNLIVHMRRHTGEKPYKCDFCDKGFPRSSDLQCHRRSHTGEKPCVCRVCGKGFSRSNKLSRHMRVHTGQRPYKCTYCEKAFSQSNDLTLHIRRHTGDRPYICEICGDRFIQGTALQNHRRTHGHFPSAPAQAPPQLPYLNTLGVTDSMTQ